MSEIEHAKMLVRLANADLKALSVMLDANTFEESVFGFHAQQAVEKSLKAWIEYLGGDFRDEVDFDPGPGIKLEDSSGVGFLLKIKEYGYW